MEIYLGKWPILFCKSIQTPLGKLYRTYPMYRWLWASKCQSKHKMFFWLLLKNRLKPKGVLRRKNNVFLDSYHCELCLFQKEEKLKHLFFQMSICKELLESNRGYIVPTWLMAERATRNIKRAIKLPFAIDIIISNVLKHLD
jgi:hypothetical protein